MLPRQLCALVVVIVVVYCDGGLVLKYNIQGLVRLNGPCRGFFTNISTEIVYKCGLGLIWLFIKAPAGLSYPECELWLGKKSDKLECLFTHCTDCEKITFNRDLYLRSSSD